MASFATPNNGAYRSLRGYDFLFPQDDHGSGDRYRHGPPGYIYNPTASSQPSLDVSILCSNCRTMSPLFGTSATLLESSGWWLVRMWLVFFFNLYRKKMEKTSSKYKHHLPVNHIMWEKMVNHLLIPCYFCRKSSSSQLPLQNSEHGERARSHGIAGRKSPRSLVCSKIQGTTTMRR